MRDDDRSTGVAELKAWVRGLLWPHRGDGASRPHGNHGSNEMSYRTESDRNEEAARGNRHQGRQPTDTNRRGWDEERQGPGSRYARDDGRGGDGVSDPWSAPQGPDSRSREGGGLHRTDFDDEYQGWSGYAGQGLGEDAGYRGQRGERPPQFGYGRGGPERDEYGDAGYGRGFAAEGRRWGQQGPGQGDLPRGAPRYGAPAAGGGHLRGREYGGSHGSGRGSYGAAHEAYAQDWRGDAGGGRQGASFRGRGPRNYVRSDARIAEDLNERLTDDPSVDAGEIEVSVKDGLATLTGSVESRWMKHRAEDIVEACSGVKDIDNRIRVPPPSGQSRSGDRSGQQGTGTSAGNGQTAGIDAGTTHTVGSSGRVA